jgi:hypothetical protein
MTRAGALPKPVLALIGAGVSAGLMASARAEPTPLAAQIKATYLDKFGDFVDWPAAAFGGPSDPVRLCVVGDDPFGPMLDQATHGQKVGSHPVLLVRLDKIERGAPCHILFVAGSAKQSVADALSKVRGDPVLTITDTAEPSAQGMINFVVLSNRVRFQIDMASATQSGLMISSKLLSLAVKPEG